MANAAIYVRLSDEDRDKRNSFDESESVTNQRAMLRVFTGSADCENITKENNNEKNNAVYRGDDF